MLTDVGGLIPNAAGDMPGCRTMGRPAPGIEIGMRNDGCIIPGCPGVPFILGVGRKLLSS